MCDAIHKSVQTIQETPKLKLLSKQGIKNIRAKNSLSAR